MQNYKNNYQKINLVTKIGEFFLYVWPSRYGREPVALVTKKIDVSKPVLVRIHSECINADVFHGKSCDCGEQKIKSLKMIYKSGNGIFIYDRDEGRGIGLFNKVKALKLQEQGLNTYEANIKLGHPADARSYKVACEILAALKIKKLDSLLITRLKSKP